jgi:hypothetical protein
MVFQRDPSTPQYRYAAAAFSYNAAHVMGRAVPVDVSVLGCRLRFRLVNGICGSDLHEYCDGATH